MKIWIAAILLAGSQIGHAACPPEGQTRDELLAWRDAGFTLPKDADPDLDARAPGILGCLWSADPVLREEVAYQALSIWLDGKKLKKPTLLAIEAQLIERLTSKKLDRDGFARSYSALALAEMIKADRLKRFLSDEQLAELIEEASVYLEKIGDYRGYDEKAGWRHGIAHGADLLNQIVMHPRVLRAGVERVLIAISSQVAPENGHFYIYGEPERLALPVLYAAQRVRFSADEWRQWFADIADVPEEGSLFDSQLGLARRHNLQAFLLALYVNVNESDDAELQQALLDPVTEALKALQ